MEQKSEEEEPYSAYLADKIQIFAPHYCHQAKP
jgi:hypothetical protein